MTHLGHFCHSYPCLNGYVGSMWRSLEDRRLERRVGIDGVLEQLREIGDGD